MDNGKSFQRQLSHPLTCNSQTDRLPVIPRDNKSNEIYGLLAKINEKLSLGHFEVWLDDGWPIYRCSIPVPKNLVMCKGQIEQISIITLEECEKFYPAFQFLAWDNKSACDSLKHLMLETQGEV